MPTKHETMVVTVDNALSANGTFGWQVTDERGRVIFGSGRCSSEAEASAAAWKFVDKAQGLGHPYPHPNDGAIVAKLVELGLSDEAERVRLWFDGRAPYMGGKLGEGEDRVCQAIRAVMAARDEGRDVGRLRGLAVCLLALIDEGAGDGR